MLNRTQRLLRARSLSLILFTLVHRAVSRSVLDSGWSSSSSSQQSWNGLDTLGVRVVKPVYAILPITEDGRANVTVVLTVWLRRVGGNNGPPFGMPHQTKESIRMMVWVDNPINLLNRKFGHLKLPAEHGSWQPRLSLETVEPGPMLLANLEPGETQRHMVRDHSLRPYSFIVDLPYGTGECFKLVEASYPKHKAPICLPPAASDGVCTGLARPEVHTAATPALYTAIGPIRHTTSTRDWGGHHSQIGIRLLNYVSYHINMGVSGLLLYSDELSRHYMRKEPELAELMRRGHLRLVHWDMPERAHDDTDGVGRPLGYNYDQALFASHAMLGLSACGTNVMLMVTDIDEFIYFPKPGRRWPDCLGTCMGTSTRSGDPVTLHQLQRFEVLSSEVPPEEESRLWLIPGTLGKPDSGSSGSAGSKLGAILHPLAYYNLVFRQPLSQMHGKPVVLPAADVVLFFVHEGAPMYGKVQMVHHRCMVLLHVPNFFGGRRLAAQEGKDMTVLQHFKHWLFAKGGQADEWTAEA